jgi:hypothetical protein
VQTIASGGWIPLETLLAADYSSPLFQQPGLVLPAYAECWLLTHMLAFDQRYAPKWNEMIGAMSARAGAGTLAQVYGRDSRQIEMDLQLYFRIGRNNRLAVSIAPAPRGEALEMSPDANLSARLALADLLSHYRGRREQAREAYESLAHDYPEEPSVELGIASLAVRDGNHSEAEVHRARAAILADTGQLPPQAAR